MKAAEQGRSKYTISNTNGPKIECKTSPNQLSFCGFTIKYNI